MESGKRKPSRKNFHALAQKLDINWCYYRGELDTADLEVFELRKRQRVANIKGRRQECLEHKGKQHSMEYQKLYRYTYYVADFFAIDYAIRFAKKYYEENFNSEMVWY